MNSQKWCVIMCHFCTDMIIPNKTVIDFPNNKPLVSNQTKDLLHRKQAGFKQGDLNAVMELKKAVTVQLNKDKTKYIRIQLRNN